jgi:hypothetical protein
MNEENNSLSLELLHEVKRTSKRWFILFIITLVLFFVTNLAWLYAWTLPVEESTTTTTYDLDSEDNGNAIVNTDGEVNINGTGTNK